LGLCFSFRGGCGKCPFDVQEKVDKFSIVLVFVFEDAVKECFYPCLGRFFIHVRENINDLILVSVVGLVIKCKVYLCILYEGYEVILISIEDFRRVDLEFFVGHGFFFDGCLTGGLTGGLTGDWTGGSICGWRGGLLLPTFSVCESVLIDCRGASSSDI